MDAVGIFLSGEDSGNSSGDVSRSRRLLREKGERDARENEVRAGLLDGNLVVEEFWGGVI